jgi:SAM-dependent methyltransferase
LKFDKHTLERLIPEQIVNDETTGTQTFQLHLERYRFASARLRGLSTILDLACGVGYGSRFLKESLPEARVIGVDLSPEAIKHAASNYSAPGVTFIVADAMSFIGGPFDAVVSLETIEHLPDPQAFVQRVATKLLRPGGTFVGSVPVTPSVDANPHHLTDFTGRSFGELLSTNGLFEFDRLYQVQPFSPFAVMTRTEKRMQGMRTNLLRYYCENPKSVLSRLAAILVHGFNNKYLTVAAKSNG